MTTGETEDLEPQETEAGNGTSPYEGVKVVVHVKDGRVLVGVEKPDHDPQFIFPGAAPEEMFGAEGINRLADWLTAAETRWAETGDKWAKYDRPKPPPKEPAPARSRGRGRQQPQAAEPAAAPAPEPEPEVTRPRLF